MDATAHQTDRVAYARRWLNDAGQFFTHPISVVRRVRREDLLPDFLAGLTVAFVMLPQAIAYALIAELPPETGIYAAIVAAIVGAMWGSSWHLHTGPTNAASLLVLSTLSATLVVGSGEYVAAAALMAIMVGVARVMLGLARLGTLVNFVAESVIVGFTAGAGVLIGANQLRHLLRVEVASDPALLRTVWQIGVHVDETHLITLGLGVLTMAIVLLLGRFRPRWPATLISIFIVSGLVAIFRLDEAGVRVLGELPRGLPPFQVPRIEYGLIRDLSTGALAVSLVGLIEALSIAHAISAESGQTLDNDQEFVGQGLANIAVGFFSGYTCSGSFTRSAINYEANARTPLAAVFSGLLVLVLMWVFAPFAAFLPRAALAGIIIVTAYKMVNRAEMRRIWRTSVGDSVIMLGTLAATLLLPIEFAVLTGILIAFLRYISQTAAPAVQSVVPDSSFVHLRYQPDKPVCPQLAVITIGGSLYFGATHHVETHITENHQAHPDQIYLLLRMHRVNLIDFSGVKMLQNVLHRYREEGGDVYLTGLRPSVYATLESGGFVDELGKDHILPQERVIAHLFDHVLDPARCIYHCQERVWRECQALPKATCDCALPARMSRKAVARLSVPELLQRLDAAEAPTVIDVREPAEYAAGHIDGALLRPLPDILAGRVTEWPGGEIVLTCRSSRRSVRAAQAIAAASGRQVEVLDGGMLAWEEAGLPEVIA